MKTLVWLASYPKSGNTWVRALLANYLMGGDQPLPLDQVTRISFGDAALEPMRALAGGKDPLLLPPARQLELREANLRRIATAGPRVNFIKSHNANARVGGRLLVPPGLTSAAIHIVRNPLDVAVSYADHWNLPLAAAAEQMGRAKNAIPPNPRTMTQFLGSWSEHTQGWAGAGPFRVLTLRYEDMLDDTARVLASVLRHIGAPIDSGIVAQAVEFASYRTLRSLEDKQGFAEKGQAQERFFRTGTAGNWKTALPDAVAEKIRADHGSVMKRFGYS